MDRSAKALARNYAEQFDRSTLLTWRGMAYQMRDVLVLDARRQCRSVDGITLQQATKLENLAKAINDLLRMQEGDFS